MDRGYIAGKGGNMKIYRHWVRCRETFRIGDVPKDFVIYGASNLSEADALEDARRKTAQIRERINGIPGSGIPEDYEVSIREEILNELQPGNIVTRNRYGAEVLNSETILFADADDICFRLRRRPGFFGRLFGKKEESLAEYAENILKELCDSIRPEWKEKGTIRVYRTKKGWRILLAGLQADPGSDEGNCILRRLHSDWIYTTLCEKQRCCRARLTPKPSRIGVKTLKLSYPYEKDFLPQFEAWKREYREKSGKYAVCHLVRTFGVPPSEADRKIIEYHDAVCRSETDLPLA